jgi:hypothetical protein
MCRPPSMNSFRQAQTPSREDASRLNQIRIRHPRKYSRHPRKYSRHPRERGGPRPCQLPIDSSAAFILTAAPRRLT